MVLNTNPTEHQSYQKPTHASNVTIKNMEAACASIYNVDPAKVKYCFEQGFSLGLSLKMRVIVIVAWSVSIIFICIIVYISVGNIYLSIYIYRF